MIHLQSTKKTYIFIFKKRVPRGAEMSDFTHRKVWPLNQSRTVGTRSCQWLPSTSADPARRATHRGGVLSSKRSPPWMIKSTFAASYSLRFVFLFFFFLLFVFFFRCRVSINSTRNNGL